MTKEDTGVILHEFGHAIGLLQYVFSIFLANTFTWLFTSEHQSPVRDQTLTFDEEAIYDAYSEPPNSWSRQDVKNQIMDVYMLRDVSNFSKLDVSYRLPSCFLVSTSFYQMTSIMCYK